MLHFGYRRSRSLILIVVGPNKHDTLLRYYCSCGYLITTTAPIDYSPYRNGTAAPDHRCARLETRKPRPLLLDRLNVLGATTRSAQYGTSLLEVDVVICGSTTNVPEGLKRSMGIASAIFCYYAQGAAGVALTLPIYP